MAKRTKKKSSAKKLAARKPRSARKIHAKKASRRADSKSSARGRNAARRSVKSKLKSTDSPAILLGLNHREKKLDPFTRKPKQKLLELRHAMVGSMAVNRSPRCWDGLRRKAAKPRKRKSRKPK